MPTLLRTLLWPIADPRWQSKIDQRCYAARLTPVAFLEMPEDNRPLVVGGHLLAPVELWADGSVRVQDKVFPLGTNFEIRLGKKEEVYREGELLFILEDNTPLFILTHEKGGWRQWRLQHPTFLQALMSDTHRVREFGARFTMSTIFLLLLAPFLIFVLDLVFNFTGLLR